MKPYILDKNPAFLPNHIVTSVSFSTIKTNKQKLSKWINCNCLCKTVKILRNHRNPLEGNSSLVPFCNSVLIATIKEDCNFCERRPPCCSIKQCIVFV